MITLDQIAKAQSEYMVKHHKIPTRIVMNPVGADKLNKYLRNKMLEDIKTPEIRAEIEARWPEDVKEDGSSIRGLRICFAVHYAEDYFEVTD